MWFDFLLEPQFCKYTFRTRGESVCWPASSTSGKRAEPAGMLNKAQTFEEEIQSVVPTPYCLEGDTSPSQSQFTQMSTILLMMNTSQPQISGWIRKNTQLLPRALIGQKNRWTASSQERDKGPHQDKAKTVSLWTSGAVTHNIKYGGILPVW